MEKKIGIGIIGASGYGAGELLRLLVNHPDVDVVSLVSRTQSPITDLHPHLLDFYDLKCEPELNIDAIKNYEQQIVFSALPHGVSAKTISALLANYNQPNFHIIDLSGDFRLSNPEQHSKFYPESPLCEDIRSKFCYGLPELVGTSTISKAQHISNPGCYATACILSVAPLIKKYRGSVFFNACSGTSGAGRNPTQTTHHPEMSTNITAYKVLQHRHEPEIQQEIGSELPCSFVPHLIPIARGIYVTTHIELNEFVALENIVELYKEFYANKRFIRLRSTPPQLEHVVGSNFCDISIEVRDRRVIVMCAIDNLVKGMAGQAIQNMNLICGLKEDTALSFPPSGLI